MRNSFAKNGGFLQVGIYCTCRELRYRLQQFNGDDAEVMSMQCHKTGV